MRVVAQAVLPAVFWAGAGLRLATAGSNRPQRTLGFALAAVATALTLDLAPVYLAVDRLTGVANLADLGEHLAGVTGVALLLEVVRGVTGPAKPAGEGRRPVWLWLAVTAALTALFVSAPVDQEATRFTARYRQVWQVAAYWAVTVAYFAVVLAELARLILRHGRHARRPALRIGFGVIGVGVLCGVGYSTAKMVEVIAGQAQHGSALADAAATTADVILPVGGVIIGTGLLIPALTSRAARARRSLAAYVALRRLRPLWDNLCQAVPHVILYRPPGRVAEALTWTDTQFRLHRRMIEIMDAALTLRTYTPPPAVPAAEAAARQAGLSGQRAAAFVEACWLAAGRAAYLAGRPPQDGQLPALYGVGEQARDEVAFLLDVATTYRRCTPAHDTGWPANLAQAAR